jgi:hypothetical protein
MITKKQYQVMGSGRAEVLDYLDANPNFTVIDIGATRDPWAGGRITAVVDIDAENAPPNVKAFEGNVSLPYVWAEIADYVQENGKFDYAICTGMLEDIALPKLVCDQLGNIAKEGYISVPSKYSELTRVNLPWRGWMHHRWIFNLDRDGFFTAYPKLTFVEHIPKFNDVAEQACDENIEIGVWWKEKIGLKVFNNDFIHQGAGDDKMISMYVLSLID